MKMKNTFCFPRQLILCLICWLNTLIVADNAHAAFGDIVAQYTFPASSFTMSPTQPLMYATIPSQNSVAIINTILWSLRTRSLLDRVRQTSPSRRTDRRLISRTAHQTLWRFLIRRVERS